MQEQSISMSLADWAADNDPFQGYEPAHTGDTLSELAILTRAPRTDEHRPSAIIPDDYTFVALGYQRIDGMADVYAVTEQRKILAEHMQRTGGSYSKHSHGGNCHICGASCVYTVIFHHAKTNTYIRTGGDCAQKLEMGGAAQLNAFRKTLENAREAQAGKKKAQAILSDAGLSKAWDIFSNVDSLPAGRLPYEEATIIDMVSKLVKYGNLSDKAKSYLGVLLTKIPQRAQREQEQAQVNTRRPECPEGKVTITGLVVSIKDHVTDFGTVPKMTVESDSGFMVWATVPSAVAVSKGDRITFTATVTRSNDKRYFGFAKRPSKAVVTPAVKAEATAAQ